MNLIVPPVLFLLCFATFVSDTNSLNRGTQGKKSATKKHLDSKNLGHDYVEEPELEFRSARRKRFSLFDVEVGRWKEEEIRYCFHKSIADDTSKTASILRAMRTFERATRKTYVEVSVGGKCQVEISLKEDMEKKVGTKDDKAAWAYAPAPGDDPGRGQAANIVFDAEEDWTTYKTDDDPCKTKPGVLVESVALHELGHTWGLNHSKVDTAVMFPVDNEEVELQQDDLDGLKALGYTIYGPKPVCVTGFDAAGYDKDYDKDYVYFIKGRRFWKRHIDPTKRTENSVETKLKCFPQSFPKDEEKVTVFHLMKQRDDNVWTPFLERYVVDEKKFKDKVDAVIYLEKINKYLVISNTEIRVCNELLEISTSKCESPQKLNIDANGVPVDAAYANEDDTTLHLLKYMDEYVLQYDWGEINNTMSFRLPKKQNLRDVWKLYFMSSSCDGPGIHWRVMFFGVVYFIAIFSIIVIAMVLERKGYIKRRMPPPRPRRKPPQPQQKNNPNLENSTSPAPSSPEQVYFIGVDHNKS